MISFMFKALMVLTFFFLGSEFKAKYVKHSGTLRSPRLFFFFLSFFPFVCEGLFNEGSSFSPDGKNNEEQHCRVCETCLKYDSLCSLVAAKGVMNHTFVADYFLFLFCLE